MVSDIISNPDNACKTNKSRRGRFVSFIKAAPSTLAEIPPKPRDPELFLGPYQELSKKL